MKTLLRHLSLAAALLCALPASAQTTPAPGAALWEQARGYYAAGSYPQALPLAVQAAQADPANPEFYLGIARILFWLERYDEAVFYYDTYLTHFGPTLPANLPARNRVDRVRDERGSANEGRTDPAAPVAMPPVLQSTREALIAWIDRGTIITSSGGGAWSQWENLIRAGYAVPDLPELRTRLSGALLDEAELLVNGRLARMPSLSYEQWQIQKRRLDAWTSLNPTGPAASATQSAVPNAALDPTIAAQLARPRAVENVTAQRAICDGQLEYLNLNYERAAAYFSAAIAADPDLLPAHMGLLNALFQSDATAGDWSQRLAAFEAAVQRVDPTALSAVEIYRATFAAEAGDIDAAVEILATTLGI